MEGQVDFDDMLWRVDINMLTESRKEMLVA